MQEFLSRLLIAFFLCGTLVFGDGVTVIAERDEGFIRRVVLQPGVWKGTVKEKVADLSIGLDLGFANLELLRGLGIASGYRYEVEPTYDGPYYHRVDRWRVGLNLKPGDLIKSALDLPISFNISKSSDVLFVRYFPTRKQALLVKPYHIAQLPMTAENVREQLVPGDFVALPGRMNIMMSAQLSTGPLAFKAKAGSHWLMRAEYQIHVLRMQNDRVRLRIITRREREKGWIGARVGAGFKLFGMEFSDTTITSFFDLNLAAGSVTTQVGNLFFMDFVFDLSSEKARRAYDSILSSKYKFKDLELLNPFKKHGDVNQEVIADATAAEALFFQDRHLPKEKRRVDRIFKGFNEYERKGSRIKLGANLVRYDRGGHTTENHLVHYDHLNRKSHYFFANSTMRKNARLLFGWRERKVQHNVGALFRSNENKEINEFLDFSVSVLIRDKKLSSREQRDIRSFMELNLTPEILRKTGLHKWDFSTSKKNAKFYFQIFFHKQAFDALRNLSSESIQEAYIDYLNQNGDALFLSQNDEQSQFLGFLHPDNTEMLQKLASVLQIEDHQDHKAKIRMATNLRKNHAFMKHGVGFLLSLLPRRLRSDSILIRMQLKAQNEEPVIFNYGKKLKSDFYDDLQYIQAMLDQSSFEMRAEALEQKREEPNPVAPRLLKQKRIFQKLYSQ